MPSNGACRPVPLRKAVTLIAAFVLAAAAFDAFAPAMNPSALNSSGAIEFLDVPPFRLGSEQLEAHYRELIAMTTHLRKGIPPHDYANYSGPLIEDY